MTTYTVCIDRDPSNGMHVKAGPWVAATRMPVLGSAGPIGPVPGDRVTGRSPGGLVHGTLGLDGRSVRSEGSGRMYRCTDITSYAPGRRD